MTNTDGEPVRFVEQLFKVSRGKRDEVVARILGQEGVFLDEDGARATVMTFTKPGNAMHSTWKNTSLATVRVTGSKLTLQASSVERADRLTALLETVLSGVARKGERSVRAPPELRGVTEPVAVDAEVLPARHA